MGNATTIVIMGGTGDLAQRKLMPALFNLWCKGRLPESTRVVGMARTLFHDEAYRELLWNGLQDHGGRAVREEDWRAFASRLYYMNGDTTDRAAFLGLQRKLAELEDAGEANRLYYLAIAPSLYTPAVECLRDSGLARQHRGWRRLVVEKPFGNDEQSARSLNETIHSAFDESQVFRIDHYLGKETVQNLLALRFANTIFEPLWDRNYVDNVQITVAEDVDVGGRAGYYDRAGVVRDMLQNHLLQLLCLVAMEPPILGTADALRSKKVDVLDAVRRWSPEECRTQAVLGQYEGYHLAPGVASDSRTPTYVALRTYIDNWRWRGVPFYLRSGKAMAAKLSEIVIQFKRPPLSIFPSTLATGPSPNALSVCIQPDEGVHLRFEAKVPEQGMRTEPVNMEFHYRQSFGLEELPDAYEPLVEDMLEGDASLFIRADQIERAWNIVDPLIACLEKPSAGPLQTYARGSWGPAAADKLLAAEGHQWVTLCHHD